MGYKETARFLGVVAQHNIYDFDFPSGISC